MAAEGPSSREGWRRRLADVLEFDADTLSDKTRLVEDLGVDSLAMMSLLGWLDTQGVTIREPRALRSVEDVLALLDQLPAQRNLSFVVVGGPGRPGVAADPAGLPSLPPDRSPLAPVLGNGTYQLTPIEEGDLPFLYTLAVHPETSYRWRYRGNPPPPERFGTDLWGNVLVQFVARGTKTGDRAGLVVAYAADLAHGHAHLGAVFTPDHAGTGLAAGATALFVRYLFHTFPLRKLYLEVPGFNWPQVASAAGKLFEVEGVLRDHDFYAGRYWDKYLCAVYPPDGGPLPAPPAP